MPQIEIKHEKEVESDESQSECQVSVKEIAEDSSLPKEDMKELDESSYG